MLGSKARPRSGSRGGRGTATLAATDLEQQIRGLAELERGALEARWQERFGNPPPRRASRAFMMRTLAHQLQLDLHGGFDLHTARRLDELIAALGTGKELNQAPASPRLRPGIRLIREWRGELLEVLVLEEGFAFRGRIFSSLSRVAHEVTGTKWNGHRFFGLRTAKGKPAGQAGKADA